MTNISPRLLLAAAAVLWLALGNSDEAAGSAPDLPPLARDVLRELVEIDTTVGQGCTKAAEAMATRCRVAGFTDAEVNLLGSDPDRQNLIIRLRGRGTAKPILFISHLDVVVAPREGWISEPFRLTERDGYFYGRGVVDAKGPAAQLVATLLRLRAEQFVPDRDIVVALTADEETGPANGILWLLSERPDVMDVAYCVNLDAGGGRIEKGRRRMTVQTSEKTYLSFRLRTQSNGGHSSVPGRDNAIDRLAAGLSRIAHHSFPFRFNETTRGYFARMAQEESGSTADDLKAVANDPPDLAAAERLAESSPLLNSILHTTCVVTRISGGQADNALPQTAEAILNCRLFPGDSPEFVRDAIVRVVADPEIQVTALGAGTSSPASPLVPEVVTAVERLCRERWPGVPVLPVMDPWASDSAKLRRAGITTLGLSGNFGEVGSSNAHGANERVRVQNFEDGAEFLYDLMKTLAGCPPPETLAPGTGREEWSAPPRFRRDGKYLFFTRRTAGRANDVRRSDPSAVAELAAIRHITPGAPSSPPGTSP